MSRAAQAMTAVLRKDFLQLWPLVAATVVLLLLRNVLLAGPVDPNSGMGVLVQASSAIACCVLLVAIIQQDALVSEQHDWLTRPIPRISLFGAKAIFVLAAIAVPADLSALVAALISGRSVAESVVMGSAFTVLWVAPLLMLAAISTMTRSLLQAAGMLLGIAVVLTATEPLIARLDGAGEEVFAGGSAWIPLWMYLSLLILASAVVIYLQYTRRNLRASRAIVVAAFVLALCVPAFLTWPAVFGIQKTLSSGSDPRTLEATLVPGCFPVITVNPFGPTRAGPPGVNPWNESRLEPGAWSPESREAVGANAVGFSTTLDSTVPPGWRASIGYVRAAYLREDGTILAPLKPSRLTPSRQIRADGAASDSHFWLISRSTYNSLHAQNVHLRLQYSMSLLEPVATTTIPADRTPHYASGLGYCTAKVVPSKQSTEITCLKRGSQPTYLTANFAGEPAYNAWPSNFPDYTPAFLELLSVRERKLQLPLSRNSTAPSITITAFEARAHLSREFALPGVLGGAQCTL